MKKITYAILGLSLIAIGCSSSVSQTKSDNAFILEAIDDHLNVLVVKIVDKETGCKYILNVKRGSGANSVVQMLDKDGKPLCRK